MSAAECHRNSRLLPRRTAATGDQINQAPGIKMFVVLQDGISLARDFRT
jgi:hypothetical protein